MTSEQNVEKFLEIESGALKVAEELKELQRETENHLTASRGFSTALTQIEGLSQSVGEGANQLAALCQTLRDGFLSDVLLEIKGIRGQMSAIKRLMIVGLASVLILQVITVALVIVV